MPTVIETHEPEIQETPYIRKPAIHGGGPDVNLQPIPVRVLFSDSLLESGVRERKRRSFATTVSFAFQCVLIGFMLIVPLMFTEAGKSFDHGDTLSSAAINSLPRLVARVCELVEHLSNASLVNASLNV